MMMIVVVVVVVVDSRAEQRKRISFASIWYRRRIRTL